MSAVCGNVVTNNVLNGISDWTDPENYDNKRVPLAGDVVQIPAGCTGTVSTAASLEVVSRVWQIRPLGETSTIIFDFASGEVTNNSAIAYGNNGVYNLQRGRIIKRGAGTLVFTAENRCGDTLTGNDFRNAYDYATRWIDVEAGSLKMPPNVGRHQFQYGRTTVAQDAFFYLPTLDAANPGDCPARYVMFSSIDGAGTITNAMATGTEIRPSGGTFAGVLGGPMSLRVYARVDLTGTTSSITGDVTPTSNNDALTSNAGTIGVAKFGSSGELSSIGKQSYTVIGSGGGGFVYLGESGEKTSKGFYMWDYDVANGSMFFDGGACGGVEFAGKWLVLGNSETRHQIYLLGTNAVSECIAACQISTNIYLHKRGSGVWHFVDRADQMWGDSLAIEEGALKFDSIAESGTLCSLGWGIRKRLPYRGVYDHSKDVGYAFTLGGTSTSLAMLQYNGTNQQTCTTRPIAITGEGTLKGSDQPGGILGFANIWAKDASGGTMILDGVAGTTNVVANVADSNGVVNVRKVGAGCWRLTGDIALTGDITAEGGTLEVENMPANAPYGWFRFTARELNTYKLGSGERNLLNLMEFALYDTNGVRQLINPICHFPAENISASGSYKNWASYLLLELGAACRGREGYGYYSQYGRGLDKLFEESAPGGAADYAMLQEGSYHNGALQQINRNNPNSFFTIVMRLTNGTPTIASYDMVKHRSNHPVCWTMEGSVDGVVWDELAKVDDYEIPADCVQGDWLSDGQTFVKGEVRKYDNVNKKGFPLSALYSTRSGCESGNIRAIGAKNGGTLRFAGSAFVANALVADPLAESAGTIENASLASSGVLHLSGIVSGPGGFAAKLTLKNCVGHDNLKRWDVSVGGVNSAWRISVDAEGNVNLVPRGMCVLIL
jgi:hypothetical protein